MDRVTGTANATTLSRSLKDQIGKVLNSPEGSQEERDVKAMGMAYNFMRDMGVKRGAVGPGEGYGEKLAIGDDFNQMWVDLGEAEARLREKDPQAWQRMMNEESDKYYRDRRIADGDAHAMERALSNNLAGWEEGSTMAREAGLRMQYKEALRMLNKLDSQGISMTSPVRMEMEAKVRQLQGQADSNRKVRHQEQLTAIADLKDRLDAPGITSFELKAAREALRRMEQEERGFIDPNYQIEAAVEANKEEVSQFDGKTPMERLQRYFSALLYEEKRLSSRITGDATPAAGAAEQVYGVLPLVGREWTPDEVRYKQVREKIRSLAPVVYLNEADVSTEGVGTAGARNFLEVLTGGGGIVASGGASGPMNLESPQARAGNITEAMMVAGLDPEKAMTTNYRDAINRNIEGYGLGDAQYWAEQAGMVGAIMIQAAPGGMLTKGLGANALIARVGNAMEKSPRAAKAVKLLMNSAKRGAEFEFSGRMSPNQAEELNFASGLLGGFGEAAGKGIIKTGEKLVARVFGDRAQQAFGLIAQYGADKNLLGRAMAAGRDRASMGIGESFGESVESIVHAWQQSEPGHGFWQGMEDEFGKTFDDNVKFFVSTFMLGLALGGGNDGGVAQDLMANARQQYANATPEQQEIMDEVLEDTGQGLEEAHTEAIGQMEGEGGAGVTVEAPAMELTPEAQAAQEELEKSRKAAEMLGTGSSGRTIEDSVPEGMDFNDFMAGRMDEDIRGLERRLENPDLSETQRAALESEIEQKKKAKKGFEQMRDQTAFRGVAPTTEEVTTAETENTETEQPAGEQQAPSNTIEIDGQQIELPVIEGLNPPQSPVSEPVAPSTEPVPVTETTPVDDNKPLDKGDEIRQVMDKITEAIRQSLGANAAEKINQYADEIISGKDRAKVTEGLNERWIAEIDRLVEAKRNSQQEVVHDEATVEQPTAEIPAPPPIEVGNEIEYMQGPQSNRTKKKGKVTEILPDGKYRLEIEVGGQKTTTVVSEENIVREMAPVSPGARQIGENTVVPPPATQDISPQTPTEAQAGGETTQQPSIEMDALAVADLGRQVANALVEAGKYTRENWMAAMNTYGPIVTPHLDRAWQSVSRDMPDRAKPRGKPEKKKEEAKDEPNPTKERGTYTMLDRYRETNPESTNEALDRARAEARTSYQQMSLETEFDEAQAEIDSMGGHYGAYTHLVTTGDISPRIQSMRLLSMRFFADMADHFAEEAEAKRRQAREATNDADRERLENEAKEAEKLRDNAVERMDKLTSVTAIAATTAGQATAVNAQWRTLMENQVGYIRAKIDQHNRSMMEGSSEQSKKRRKKAKDAKDGLNEDRTEIGDQVANSDLSDNMADAVAEERAKPKEKPRQQDKKRGLGKTKDQIAEIKRKALEDMRKAGRAGFAGSLGSPAALDFIDAAARYGYALVAEGVITFKEWSARMKTDIPELTEEQINAAWSHDVDGKPVSDHARGELEEKAKPRKRTAQQKQSLRGHIREALREHFRKGADPGISLQQRLMDTADLTAEEAQYVYEAVREEFEKRAADRVKRRADAMKRKPSKPRPKGRADVQKAIDAMVDGEFTDDQVREIFADRLDLVPNLTSEQIAEMRRLGRNLSRTKPRSRLEQIALMALDRYASGLLPRDSIGSTTLDLIRDVSYANTLMGVPTHLKNLFSSMKTIAASILQDITNVSRWIQSVQLAMKANDGQRMRTFLRASPITSIMVKLSSLHRGISHGLSMATDIMKHGYSDSKYMEQAKSKLGRFQTSLERLKLPFPVAALKYVGRALAAEDAFNFAVAHEWSLVDAVRRHNLNSPEASLTRWVNQQLARENPNYQAAQTQAEQEVDQAATVTPMTNKRKARLIKIRTREILEENLDLTQEERESAESIARSQIFTEHRHGSFGKLATLLGKIGRTKLGWIFFPFTRIIGNLGDTYMDYVPFYSILRAHGISPTGIAQAMGLTKKSAMMGLDGKSMKERMQAVLSGDVDAKYLEQMGRAWLSTILAMVAFALVGDDEDDAVYVSGASHPEYPNYFWMFGQPLFSWENSPPMAPICAIMAESIEYKKAHPTDESGLADRMMFAMKSAEGSIAGLSVAESAFNFTKLVSAGFELAGEMNNREAFKKSFEKLLNQSGGSFLGMATRFLPQRNALIEQLRQLYDPTVFKQRDFTEMLEYSLTGAFYRDLKGKVGAVDIFGEEMERIPGEDAFGYAKWFKDNVKENPRWRFLYDIGAFEKNSNGTPRVGMPQDRKILSIGEDEEAEYRSMTNEQWRKFTELSGKDFATRLDAYMVQQASDGKGLKWKQDYKKTEITEGGEINGAVAHAKELQTLARAKAKRDMKAIPVSQGGLKGQIIGK